MDARPRQHARAADAAQCSRAAALTRTQIGSLFGGMNRIKPAQFAYIAVFAAFVVIYGMRVLNGTAGRLDWLTLTVAVFLLIISAYRVLRDLGRPDR